MIICVWNVLISSISGMLYFLKFCPIFVSLAFQKIQWFPVSTFFVIHFDPPQSKPLLARIRDVHCRGWLYGNINLLIFSEPPHTRGLSFQGDFKVNYPKFVYVDKKSDNLQYNTLARWVNGTNDSSTKRLMFQALFFFS